MDEKVKWIRCRCRDQIVGGNLTPYMASVTNVSGNLMDPKDDEAYLHSQEICIRKQKDV